MQSQVTPFPYPQQRDRFIESPLPSSEDAERYVLGAILIEGALMSTVAELVKPNDFYGPLHRRVFAGMLALFESRRSIDPINIGEELKKDGPIEAIGGLSTISNLAAGLPWYSIASADIIAEYCQTIKAKRRVRDLIRTCEQIQNNALDEPDATEVLQTAQRAINAICLSDEKKGFRSLGDLSVEAVNKIAEIRNGSIEAGGLLTGLNKLDLMTGGFRKSDFIVIGARPGMGKSALAGQIALNACKENKGAVIAIFSLEMSEDQYTKRLLATKASVDLQRMQRAALNEVEMARLQQATVEFNEFNFEIDDSSSLGTVEMRSKLLGLKQKLGRVDLVIADYLQRMVTSKKTDSRQQEVSRIAQDLKSLAKDFNVPVIALSSLSRACESRTPPRPRMSDLRESGDIESEADMVAFLYRPHYYDQSQNERLAEFIIDKHRHGPTDTVQLSFMGEFTRFGNWA